MLSGNSTYSGRTTVAAGTLAAGGADVFSPQSAYVVQSAGTLELRVNSQTIASLSNAGLVNLGTGTAPGAVLTTTNYTGQGGTIALSAYLGDDSSPSDRLVINGGTASGTTTLRVINAGGPGALTTANGIPVIQAINGATTDVDAFTLTGEVRGGLFDYRPYQGGLAGSAPDNWFLRSEFNAPGTPIEPGVPPVTPGQPPLLPGQPESPVLPADPPPAVLPPGVYPIIGPEIATYSVLQPIARQMGLTTLGTMHERIGDTLTEADGGADNEGWGRSGWARLFGQQIDNRYQTFTDARASGALFGFPGRRRPVAWQLPPRRDARRLFRLWQRPCQRRRPRHQRAGHSVAATAYRLTGSGRVFRRRLLDPLRSGRLVSTAFAGHLHDGRGHQFPARQLRPRPHHFPGNGLPGAAAARAGFRAGAAGTARLAARRAGRRQ